MILAQRALTARLYALLKSPAVIYLVSSALAKSGSFVLIPLYTRRLSKGDYGDFALAQTLLAVLPTVFSFGLSSALARFFFEGKDPAKSLPRVGGIARWLAAASIGWAAVLQLLLLAFWPAGQYGISGRWELSCLIWASAGASLAAIPSVYLRAAQRPIAASCFQLAQFFSVIGGGLILVAKMNRGLRGSIEASAAAYLIDGAAGLLFILIVLKGTPTRALLREGLKFSLPFVPHFLANQVQLIGDRWTMKVAGLQDDLGGYSLASQVSAPANMTLAAWHDAASPQMGEITRSDGIPGLRRVFGRFQRSYLLSALLPGIAISLALPIVAAIVGGAFKGSLWMVPFMGLAITIESIYFPSSNVLFFANRPGIIPRITIAAGALNLGLNIVLIKWLGVWGAIAARIAAAIFRSGAMWLAARRVKPVTLDGLASEAPPPTESVQ
jgi:O-antigen/teichoic acid export membrane protein